MGRLANMLDRAIHICVTKEIWPHPLLVTQNIADSEILSKSRHVSSTPYPPAWQSKTVKNTVLQVWRHSSMEFCTTELGGMMDHLVHGRWQHQRTPERGKDTTGKYGKLDNLEEPALMRCEMKRKIYSLFNKLNILMLVIPTFLI